MELTRFPPALFAPRFRPVGTLITHGKGGIPSLYQDGVYRITEKGEQYLDGELDAEKLESDAE
ncbi:hypothetical protein [Natronomonas pharaonis]|uniref:hypothetical protein n=1 Tax=Natronomonas pharaonis TaxID=2257 RepID=UPI0006777965|nr:hypothetical protein [Natronomonas pharaonis]